MKKIKLFILITLLFLVNYSYAENEDKALFNEYKENIKFCDKYKENKIIYKIEEFKEASEYEKDDEIFNVDLRSDISYNPIKKAVYIYKENMNNIYRCAMIGVQINSLKLIKARIKATNSSEISMAFEPKVDSMINRLEMTSESSKCTIIDKKTIFNKKSILSQTTHATCKYSFYMNYLSKYYENVGNITKPSNAELLKGIDDEKANQLKQYEKTDLANRLSSVQSKIKTEFDNSIKIFPIAYHAYSEYENNYPIHFLLELIREDYMVFRDNLHSVINPINQVAYKIRDAMKK